jgi:hypothetical protein
VAGDLWPAAAEGRSSSTPTRARRCGRRSEARKRGFSDWELDLEHANGGEMKDTNCFNPTTIDDAAGNLDGVFFHIQG